MCRKRSRRCAWRSSMSIAKRGQETLTIFALPALASKWLNPAIGDWLARQPQLDIRLHATHAAVDFAASAADFALCFGDQDYPLLEKVQLFQDGVQPVCSPQRQAAGDWTRQPLIHVDWGKESQFLPGWHEWFTAAGLPPPQRRGLTYNLTSLAIDAAVAGHGILLGQQSLIQRELANGTLVPLAETVLPLSKPYYVVYPQRTLDKPKAAEFLAWLQKPRTAESRWTIVLTAAAATGPGHHLAQQQVGRTRQKNLIAGTGGQRQFANVEPLGGEIKIDAAIVEICRYGFGYPDHLIPERRFLMQRVDLRNIFLNKKARVNMLFQKLQRSGFRPTAQ
ncbi:Gcv operon activator [Serratia plymuthica]|uniref:Gcv operon activator n=1 Tax=Serratia plymuthica TaxID=82996 RepID=A0A2X4U3I0_SERPL|nr:Gcv operon activator [Serratia plymuthica]